MDKNRTRHVIAVLQVDPHRDVSAAVEALQGLQTARSVGAVALLVGSGAHGEAFVDFARDNGFPVVRCSDDDVLSGFARAADLLDADIVVRVGRDAIVDAELVDHLVAQIIERDCDLILPAEEDADSAAGIEPFTRRALDKLLLDVARDPAARRQVTRYFALHPDFVTIARAARCRRTGDIAFVAEVQARIEANAGRATLADLLALAERESPRPCMATGATALIRIESRGLGRARRMIVLARALRDREGIDPVFYVGDKPDLTQLVEQAGFDARGTNAPDLLVVDGAGETDSAARVTAAIEDCTGARLAADYAYYAPLPRALHLDWGTARTAVRIGWEWALPGLLPQAARPQRGRSPRPTVLVSIGAADPHGLTLRVAQALAALDPVFRARFVIGPGFKPSVAKTMVELRPDFETIEGAQGLATEFASCDLAITGVHVTACELAAFGVPAMYVCAGAEDALAASAYEHAGMGICLGMAGKPADLAAAVWSLLNNRARRRAMSAAGQAAVDGTAGARIASELAAALAESGRSTRVAR